MITNLLRKKVKIKKDRYCGCCLVKFPKGTTLNFQKNIIDGDFSTWYNCDTCESLLKYIEPVDGLYEEGVVREIMQGHNFETPEQLLEYFKNKKQ